MLSASLNVQDVRPVMLETDRFLELRLNEHSAFRTSAVGKHLYECEHFHYIVNLHNVSAYSSKTEVFALRARVDQAVGLCYRKET